MFIDYAELQAEDEIPMSMQDWLDEVNTFLANNKRNILESKGHISHDAAIEKAHEAYVIFRVRQDKEYVSEFDRDMEKYLKGSS